MMQKQLTADHHHSRTNRKRHNIPWWRPAESIASHRTHSTNGATISGVSGVKGEHSSQVLMGRTLSQARLLTAQDITLLLGGISEGKEHCPQLAITALHDALSDLGGSLA